MDMECKQMWNSQRISYKWKHFEPMLSVLGWIKYLYVMHATRINWNLEEVCIYILYIKRVQVAIIAREKRGANVLWEE